MKKFLLSLSFLPLISLFLLLSSTNVYANTRLEPVSYEPIACGSNCTTLRIYYNQAPPIGQGWGLMNYTPCCGWSGAAGPTNIHDTYADYTWNYPYNQGTNLVILQSTDTISSPFTIDFSITQPTNFPTFNSVEKTGYEFLPGSNLTSATVRIYYNQTPTASSGWGLVNWQNHTDWSGAAGATNIHDTYADYTFGYPYVPTSPMQYILTSSIDASSVLTIDWPTLLTNTTPTPTIQPSNNPLPVPLLKQTSEPWQGQEYDTAHLWNPASPTINRWGCAMTSAAMVFQYHGIKKLPDGTMLNPGTLNTWLKNQPDGYVGQGWTNWLALSRLSKLAKNINGISSFDALEYSNLGKTTTYQVKKDQLTNDINHNLPGILEVPGHFIVGKGIEGNTFSINDPYYDRNTLNEVYSNTFISLGRFVPSLTDLSYIMVVGDSDISFKLLDKNGNVIGESSEQQPIIDPQNPNNKNKSISILYAPKPSTGNYKLIVSGNTDKVSTISTYLYDLNGNPSIIEATNLGNSSYTISFNKNDNSQGTVNKKVTFESVIADIKTLDKNKAMNHGLADSLVALVIVTQKQFEKGHAKESNFFLDQAINLLNISKQNKKLISEEAYKLLSIDFKALKKLIND